MSPNFVIAIQAGLIEKHGGASGVRDRSLLESAVFRPFATFDGIKLYPEPADKASAIFESIVINHPFIDGNKRIGYVLMRLILSDYDLDIYASEDEKYSFVIEVTEGKHTIDSIKEWIKKHLHG